MSVFLARGNAACWLSFFSAFMIFKFVNWWKFCSMWTRASATGSFSLSPESSSSLSTMRGIFRGTSLPMFKYSPQYLFNRKSIERESKRNRRERMKTRQVVCAIFIAQKSRHTNKAHKFLKPFSIQSSGDSALTMYSLKWAIWLKVLHNFSDVFQGLQPTVLFCTLVTTAINHQQIFITFSFAYKFRGIFRGLDKETQNIWSTFLNP